jgi:V/A-type H+-transporting ATPase subunit C
LEKLRDTDYLYISSRLKALENDMLSREKLGRLVSARSGEDAVKLLVENGWEPFDPQDLGALERVMACRQQAMFALLYRYAPDGRVVDLFRLRYDYHNLKVLIKTLALGTPAPRLLSQAGTLPPAVLGHALREKEWGLLPPVMCQAAQEASELLARTGDSQLADLLLDRAMTAQMLALAEEIESEFLLGYVRLFIDVSNLRVITRAALSGKGFDYLRRAVFPGGNVSDGRLICDVSPDLLRLRFGTGALSQAAQAAAEALEAGGSLAALDLACDNALMCYIRSARLIAFGEAHVVAYLLARESELVAVRIVMAGRNAGLTEGQILERLRMSYV